MILDAIIALFGSLIQGAILLIAPLINGILYLIESLVGLVIDGFTIGRVKKKKEKETPGSALGGAITLLMVTIVMIAMAAAPRLMNREITFVAEDGHSLPYAALIIETKDGTDHLRTDNAGNVTIPRFGDIRITAKDPRYLEKSWDRAAIDDELVLTRTLLGSSLDIISDKLLGPAKK